jgi:hypothetical protein
VLVANVARLRPLTPSVMQTRTMRRSLILLVGLLSSVASGACMSVGVATPHSESTFPVVSGDRFTAVIVPAGLHVEGAWTLSEAQVLEAEPRIQACVLAQRHDLRRKLSRYIRQYWGTTHQGRSVLQVAFLDSRSYSLELLRQHGVIVLDDAGDDYFSVEFDPGSGKCTVSRSG